MKKVNLQTGSKVKYKNLYFTFGDESKIRNVFILDTVFGGNYAEYTIF